MKKIRIVSLFYLIKSIIEKCVFLNKLLGLHFFYRLIRFMLTRIFKLKFLNLRRSVDSYF